MHLKVVFFLLMSDGDNITLELKSNLLLQTHINFPRFLPIFPDFLEGLSHLAPIY
jgi:hypothetical protein